MEQHNVLEHNITIVLLTEKVHAYILEYDSKFELYLADVQVNNANSDEATLVKVFEQLQDAINYIIYTWSELLEVLEYWKKFLFTKDKPATQKQVYATCGEAANHGEVTWFFAKRTCYYRMRDVINIKLGKPVNKQQTQKEKFLSMAQ